jgi:hypothetical protein
MSNDQEQPMSFQVDWMEGFANAPRFVVEGAKYTPWALSAFPFKKVDGIHRRDAPDGSVNYFYSNGKPTEGFGGAEFKGTLEDGTEFCYKGAWSSRAACVNAAFPDDPIVDVNWGMYATAVRVETLVDWWLANQPEWGLAVVDCNDVGYTVLPTRDGAIKDTLNRCNIVVHLTSDTKADFMNAFKKGN